MKTFVVKRGVLILSVARVRCISPETFEAFGTPWRELRWRCQSAVSMGMKNSQADKAMTIQDQYMPKYFLACIEGRGLVNGTLSAAAGGSFRSGFIGGMVGRSDFTRWEGSTPG